MVHKWHMSFQVNGCKVTYFVTTNSICDHNRQSEPLWRDSEEEIGVIVANAAKIHRAYTGCVSKQRYYVACILYSEEVEYKTPHAMHSSLLRPDLEYVVQSYSITYMNIKLHKRATLYQKLLPTLSSKHYVERLKFASFYSPENREEYTWTRQKCSGSLISLTTFTTAIFINAELTWHETMAARKNTPVTRRTGTELSLNHVLTTNKLSAELVASVSSLENHLDRYSGPGGVKEDN